MTALDSGLSIGQLITQIDARIDVLRPLVRELEQLEAARAVLVADLPARKQTDRGRAAQRPAPRLRRAPRGANRTAIVELARTRPGITVAEISQSTGIARPTVHSTVYALKRAGVLERDGPGVKVVGTNASTATRPRRAVASRRTARSGRGRRHGRDRAGRARNTRSSQRADVRAAPRGSRRAPTPAEALPATTETSPATE